MFALHESDVVCCCGQSSHSYFQTEMSASHLLSLALQVSGIHYCRLNRSQMGYWSVTVDAWRSERVARCAEQRGNRSWTHCWELIRGNPEQMNRMVRAWGAERCELWMWERLQASTFPTLFPVVSKLDRQTVSWMCCRFIVSWCDWVCLLGVKENKSRKQECRSDLWHFEEACKPAEQLCALSLMFLLTMFCTVKVSLCICACTLKHV